MEEMNKEPIVTISLGEYNRLRDEAMMNRLMIDKITMFESRMDGFQRQIMDIDNRKMNK